MLEPGANGGLLVGTGRGLSRFDGERFRVIAGPGELGEGVRAMAEDAAGRVWVGAGDGTLHCFAANNHLTLAQAEGLPGAVIRCLLAAADGSLWIGTDGGGLCRWRDGKLTRWTREDGLWEGRDHPTPDRRRW
jgi:ligand-binding sensor domain-containing protein